VLHGSRGNEINRLVTEMLSLLTIVVACPLWFLYWRWSHARFSWLSFSAWLRREC